MDDKYCATCKFWNDDGDHGTTVGLRGRCRRFGLPPQSVHIVILAHEIHTMPEVVTRIVTAFDFGCVLHEESKYHG